MVAFSAVQNWKVHQDVEIHYLNKATDQKQFLLSMRLRPVNSREKPKNEFLHAISKYFPAKVNKKQENYQMVDIVWCNLKFLELKF